MQDHLANFWLDQRLCNPDSRQLFFEPNEGEFRGSLNCLQAVYGKFRLNYLGERREEISNC